MLLPFFISGFAMAKTVLIALVFFCAHFSNVHIAPFILG